MVSLLPPNIKTKTLSKKVDYQSIEQFKILARIGTRAYRLAIAPSRATQNTFYISHLEPYQDKRFPAEIK